MDAMFWKNFPATIIIYPALLATPHTTYSQSTVKEWNGFGMLPLAIFYNKIQVFIISIDRKACS